MNEVTIPLKLTGVGSMKSELRALKAEIANATDPAQMEALAKKAGELSDKIKDANDAVNVFASGSKFEQISNSFSGIQSSLMSLDFEEASEKSKVFASNLGKISKSDITGALKGLGGVVKNVGGAFVKLGLQIMANPIFIITAVITAIVVAIGLFLNKIGVLDKVLQTLMIPINMLIQGFKDLTDWMGLTTYEAEDNAKKIGKANDKVQESSKKRSEKIGSAYDFEISKAKANGKDTTQLEIAKSKALEKEGKGRIHNSQKELNALQKIASKDNAEKRKKLREQIEAEKKIIQSGVNDRKLIAIQDANEQAQKNAENASKNAEKAKEYAKNRLDAQRTIKDIELALIEDDAKREEAITNEKFARLLEDTKKNANLTKDEKLRLNALYESQRLAELATAQKKIEDAEKAHQQKITDGLKAYEDSKIEKQQELEEINYQAGLTAREKERQDLKYHYEQLLADASQYGADATNIEAEYKVKQAEQNKKFADEDEKLRLEGVEKAKNERDAKIMFANDIANGITAIGGMFIKDQKKLEKFNKASALVQIGIDTAKAISSLVAMSQANPANAVTGGGAGIAQFASGIVQIITNVAKAKSLLSNPSSTPSGGGGGGGGESPDSNTSVTMATPAVQMFGQGNNLNTQGGTKSANANQNMVVTAIVSESDITNTQTKLSKLQKSAEL
jgi:hypothetical protein